MAIHLYKISTPSTRNRTVDSRVESNSQNNLIYGQHRCGKGRNTRGITSAGHKGGDHKRLYRKIDFRPKKEDETRFIDMINMRSKIPRKTPPTSQVIKFSLNLL